MLFQCETDEFLPSFNPSQDSQAKGRGFIIYHHPPPNILTNNEEHLHFTHQSPRIPTQLPLALSFLLLKTSVHQQTSSNCVVQNWRASPRPSWSPNVTPSAGQLCLKFWNSAAPRGRPHRSPIFEGCSCSISFTSYLKRRFFLPSQAISMQILPGVQSGAACIIQGSRYLGVCAIIGKGLLSLGGSPDIGFSTFSLLLRVARRDGIAYGSSSAWSCTKCIVGWRCAAGGLFVLLTRCISEGKRCRPRFWDPCLGTWQAVYRWCLRWCLPGCLRSICENIWWVIF